MVPKNGWPLLQIYQILLYVSRIIPLVISISRIVLQHYYHILPVYQPGSPRNAVKYDKRTLNAKMVYCKYSFWTINF